jgi:hypothetical protein
MINKIKNIIDTIKDHRRWTVYLYYDGVLIKRIKARLDVINDKNHKYIINVYFKKQLFKNNKVNIIVSPTVLLHTDENKKKIYMGVAIERGVPI